MSKTIAQLWNGGLEPINYLGVNNAEIKQLESLLEQNLTKIQDALGASQKEIFQRYNDCVTEYLMVLSEQAFCDGFCLGTKIAVEALTGAEKLM